MGGIMFVVAALICLLVFGRMNFTMLIILLGTLGFGLIGFVDDFFSLVMKRSLGLTAKQKMVLQFLVSLVILILCYNRDPLSVTTQRLPILNVELNLSYFMFPILIFMMVGFVNAVNLTDGLDGLATGVSIPVFMTYFLLLNGTNGDLGTFSLIFIGCLLGFLVYNSNPAKAFMGDTGSMAIGGAVVSVALLGDMMFFLPILGGIYLAEAMSVIIQVISFKMRNGKRVFLMSPIHHHYELKGYPEQKIVVAFSVVSVVLALCVMIIF